MNIPLPHMSEFLLDEFMMPMNVTASDLSAGTGIPLYDVRAMLADEFDITPEISKNLAIISVFLIHCSMIFSVI